MPYESWTWILVILSLAGNIFVVKKNVFGQWLWAVSNVGWVSYNMYVGIHSQAFLFAVYFLFCIWGILEWNKPKLATSEE